MIKEAIGYGDTVDEAKEDAISRLGANIDEDIQIDIISMPKKKVLGIFGGSKAEVRVYVERPDKQSKKSKGKQPKKSDVQKTDTKKSEVKKAEVKKAEEKVKADKPQPVFTDAAEIPADSKTGKAIAYLNAILKNIDCKDVQIKADVHENSALIVLEGEDLGVIIGHRGETLDALQHLVSLAANNAGGYFKVTLNIGDYREKREKTLISLAERVAEQVKANNRNRALEPMSAYERRIIHTTVQEIDGVNSASVGEGSSRRVIIFPEGGTPNMPRRDNNRRRGSQARRPSNTVSSAPSRAPKHDTDVPLYGKISSNNEE